MTTLNVYSHVSGNLQKEAAAKLAALVCPRRGPSRSPVTADTYS
jgi:hypothetical protein